MLDDIRQVRPGPAAAALGIADLQLDRNGVARELLGVEFNLARLRNFGFRRTLGRLRQDGADRPESEEAALADQLTASYFRYRDQDPALFDDTLPCLQALRADYRLGLLSNGSRMPEAMGLGGIFEAVVFAQDHNVAKPDPGIFEVAERLMKVPPSACVLVGDHPLNDVAGAKRAPRRRSVGSRPGHRGGTRCGRHLIGPVAPGAQNSLRRALPGSLLVIFPYRKGGCRRQTSYTNPAHGPE